MYQIFLYLLTVSFLYTNLNTVTSFPQSADVSCLSLVQKITPDSLFNNTSIHPHLKRSLDDDYTPSSVNPLPGKSKVITTRFGADGVKPEQQCQCVLNHMCNAEHVVTLGESLPDDQR